MHELGTRRSATGAAGNKVLKRSDSDEFTEADLYLETKTSLQS